MEEQAQSQGQALTINETEHQISTDVEAGMEFLRVQQVYPCIFYSLSQ